VAVAVAQVRRVPSVRAGQMSRAIARLGAGRRLATTLSAIGATALVTGAVVATELPGSSRGASPSSSTSGSTIVQRRNLVATDTESGTLSYANPQTVFNRISGTVTSLPAIGQVIKAGQTLYRVDGSPVVLFNGTTPAYRDLSDAVTDGPDVEQLKKNLIALGFDPEHTMAVNQIFDLATAYAVERWQASLGETETGVVTLGQIVFLPGAQRITSVDTVLGSTGGSSAGASGAAASTSLTPLAPRAQFVSLTTTSAGAGSASGSGPASGAGPASGTGSGSASGIGSGSSAGAGSGSSAGGAGAAVSKAAQTACPAPGSSSQPGVTTTTTTTTTATTTTSTTPTTPGATSTTPTCATTTAPNTLITAASRAPGAAKPSSRKPSQEAVLLALLKAETLELRKSASSSSGSSRSSTTGSGATGSTRGSGTSTGASGTGGSGAGSSSTGGSGASSTGSGASSTGSGASSTGSGAGAGSAGSSAQAILQTTSNQLLVTVNLDATKQSEAVVGEQVTVQLPSGDTVGGRITQVSPIAQSSSSSSGSSSGGSGGSSSAPSATIPVTIKILGRHPVSGLDQAAVSVNFEQQVENNVLSVPVTALLATAGGGYAVQEAGALHRLLPVTPGLFAAGYVQVSGADIYSGLQVTDSQG